MDKDEHSSSWNWTLVAKGASSATRKVRSLGICVYGKGPPAAKLVKFRAVITVKDEMQNLSRI